MSSKQWFSSCCNTKGKKMLIQSNPIKFV
jgi:hypothetical protein